MLDNTANQASHLHASISNERAFILAMESLTRRLEKTESDFVGHLQKVEDRLDQLVDLTKTVAVLQQQNAQHNDALGELRAAMRETTDKFQISMTRLHTRIDEIQNHQRDKLELHSKETALAIKTNEISIGNVDKELKTWLNRGVGAWVIFAVVIGAAQTIGFRWLDAVERDKAQMVQTMDIVSKNQALMEQRLQNQESLAKDMVANLKTILEGQHTPRKR